MINREQLEQELKSDRALKVIPNAQKRVIIPVRKGIKFPKIPYITWNGDNTSGFGMLFVNETDQRSQFLEQEIGVLIAHEGLCPMGRNRQMILRSDAVLQYFGKHPEAMANQEHVEQTIEFLQKNVFRHALDDVNFWDDSAVPDIWSSDTLWLKQNFKPEDIYTKDGTFKPVISAAKCVNSCFDAVFLGPNSFIEGLGKTGKNGSWVIDQNGVRNLCTDEVFRQTYQLISKKTEKNR